MQLRPLMLALLLLGAGCLGAGDPQTQPESRDEGEATTASHTVERVLVFEGNVSGGAQAGPVGINGTHVLGSGLQSLHLSLSWNTSANGFEARAEGPGGQTTVVERGSTSQPSAEGSLEAPSPGLWRFEIAAQGPHVPDRVRLEVTGTWTMPGNATASEEAPIHTSHRADDWVAWQDVHANGSVGGEVEVEASTGQGYVNLTAGTPDVAAQQPPTRVDASEGQAAVRLHAWARGETEAEARERVRSIETAIEIAGNRTEVHARATTWDDRGVNVDVALPAGTGTDLDLETTDGQVNAYADRVTGGQLEVTNGRLLAGLRGQGELELSGTNGPIRAQFAPTGDAKLLAEVENGPIELGLLETEEIGYVVDAETTHGRITESMEEASLEGSAQEATLRTDEADARAIQVTGRAESTNGNVAFAGR